VAKNIILVGLMGAGKTTIGRHLAKRRNLQFIDLDHEIEARTGVKIPLIFEIEGETGFRERESKVLDEISRQTGLVIATGGGVVERPENREVLKRTGTVVYLHVLPQLLYERTRHDTNRPLLQVADPLHRLKELFARRYPLYREVADVVVNGRGGSVSHLVNQVEKELARCTA
jgi:shikimate kinase